MQTHSDISHIDEAIEGGLTVTPVENPAAIIRERYKALLEEPKDKEFYALVTEGLSNALKQEPLDSKLIIDTLSQIPALALLFDQDSRVSEQYSIGQHTSMVLSRLDQILDCSKLAIPLTESEVRLAALLHDIGKPLPDQKHDQHEFTLQVINDFRDVLPVDNHSFAIICSLIDNDPFGEHIGQARLKSPTKSEKSAVAELSLKRPITVEDLAEYNSLVVLKNVTLDPQIARQAEKIAADFRRRAEALNVPVKELFNLHVAFFQADTSAYTYGAVDYNGQRGFPSLEYLYVLRPEFNVDTDTILFQKNTESGILEFSPSIAYMIKQIEYYL